MSQDSILQTFLAEQKDDLCGPRPKPATFLTREAEEQPPNGLQIVEEPTQKDPQGAGQSDTAGLSSGMSSSWQEIMQQSLEVSITILWTAHGLPCPIEHPLLNIVSAATSESLRNKRSGDGTFNLIFCLEIFK